MPDSPNALSPGQRRANWVGLKTLRQRPKVVDSLPDGEPVYEVRSVRLVLRGQSPHFSRLVACERCGAMQAGAPVVSQADLDTPARPIICTDCVRKAGVSSVWQPEVARAPGERAAPQGLTRQEPAPAPKPTAAPVAAAPAPPVTDSGDAPRLQALEGRLEAMDARIEQLSRLAVAQEAALEEGRRSDEAVHTALQTALTTAVADARADAEGAEEPGAAKVTDLEVQLRQAVAALSQLVEAQRADINTLAGAMGQARTELQRVVEVTQQLAQSHNRGQQGVASAQDLEGVRAVLDERLHHLTEQLAQAAGRVAAMEVRIDRMTHTEPAPVPEWARPERSGAFQLVESLEAQLQGASSRLAALSGGHQTGAGAPGDQADAPRGDGDYGVNGGG